MKMPKTVKRYCPYCNTKTEQKVKEAKSGNKKGTLKRGSKDRAKLRNSNRGTGNLGRYSKPAVSKFKRKTKTTKKPQVVFTCIACGKAKTQKKGKRTSKLIIE